MRSFTAPGAPGRCSRCLLLSAHCVCAMVGEPRPHRPRILIVRHQWEAWKSTNTARLAELALADLRIIDMAAENPDPVRAELQQLQDAWLLYPGRESAERLATPPRTLVVLDGTWRQTRKMQRRLPELARLPRFSLESAAPAGPLTRLRESPVPSARSTLESIAAALGELDSPALGQHLLELHRHFVEQTRLARGQRPLVSPQAAATNPPRGRAT
jgi:DTW domain-containing protein